MDEHWIPQTAILVWTLSDWPLDWGVWHQFCWDTVDGNAKSESPVDRSVVNFPLFWMGFNHPFGDAGFCSHPQYVSMWKIIPILPECWGHGVYGFLWWREQERQGFCHVFHWIFRLDCLLAHIALYLQLLKYIYIYIYLYTCILTLNQRWFLKEKNIQLCLVMVITGKFTSICNTYQVFLLEFLHH